MTRVAFIGLGVMGYPMAGHVARAGHQVSVYNRTRAVAEKWLAAHEGGGHAVAGTPAEAAADADIVMTCVGADPDVEAVVLGESGAFHGMKRGAILVDHTTSSAGLARRLAGLAADRGLGFIDAPVSGGQSGAENGALTVMAGGEEGHYETAEPLIATFARKVRLIGPAGAGQLTKMVNQICIAGLVQGLSEALNLGQRAGLDMTAVLDVISQGAAQSWQMDNRAQTMLEGEFDFGFAVNWMRKDLKFCLEEAERLGISLPVTALVDQFYGDVQAMGGGRWDTSSLIARLGGDRE